MTGMQRIGYGVLAAVLLQPFMLVVSFVKAAESEYSPLEAWAVAHAALVILAVVIASLVGAVVAASRALDIEWW